MRNIPKPNAMQLQYHRDELAAFMHFGMNTFTDSEWGDGTEDPASFNPSAFEADKMVSALQEAGFKRLIVTAKHHDGFCIWPSLYTEHTVASSPYDGDILAELSAACTKYGLDMGLYLSPWDVHEPSYGYGDGHDEATDTNGDYNEYYINQIREISGNPIYGREGRFVEWWLDGAKGTGSMAQEYDFPAWIAAIRENNPDILIFGAGSEGGVHWVGNESGWAPDANWCLLPDTGRFGTGEDQVADDSANYLWSIPEVDVSINAGWFWHEGQEPKSPQKLASIYFDSVGRGSPLLLNIPPNRDGDYPDAYYEAIARFGANIRNSFRHNVADRFAVTKISEDVDSGYYVYRVLFQAPVQFDCFELKEAIDEHGQLVDRVAVRYVDRNGDLQRFQEAGTIGARRLLRGPQITTDELLVTLHSIAGEPTITTVGAYLLTDDFKPQADSSSTVLRFAETSYRVKAGESVEIRILRDDTSEAFEFYLDTPPGTAVSGQYYVDITHEARRFEIGEAELRFTVQTHPADIGDGKAFFAQLSHPAANGQTAISQCSIEIIAD